VDGVGHDREVKKDRVPSVDIGMMTRLVLFGCCEGSRDEFLRTNVY
jgi:hypothetical protein